MKCSIYGLTAQNIMINSLNIRILGNSADMERYPHSVAKNVEVSSTQKRDLDGLESAGLIQVIWDDEEVKPDSQPPQLEKKGVKTVQRLEKKSEVPNSERLEDESESVVVTPSGKPVKAKTINPNEAIPEDPNLVKASIEEAERLEKEAEKDRLMEEFIDSELEDKNLDISEQMGTEATIYTGNKQTEKVKMQNSVVPDTTTDWVDPEEAEGQTFDDINDDVDNVFTDDLTLEEDVEENDDRFIE